MGEPGEEAGGGTVAASAAGGSGRLPLRDLGLRFGRSDRQGRGRGAVRLVGSGQDSR